MVIRSRNGSLLTFGMQTEYFLSPAAIRFNLNHSIWLYNISLHTQSLGTLPIIQIFSLHIENEFLSFIGFLLLYMTYHKSHHEIRCLVVSNSCFHRCISQRPTYTRFFSCHLVTFNVNKYYYIFLLTTISRVLSVL